LRPVEVDSAAKADIRRAFVWYENQREGLGEKFVQRVREAIERIAANPAGYAKVIGEARKSELRQFPYSLWFKFKDEVVVIACLHHRRDKVLARERSLGILQFPDPQ
jgi:plasmid stabilization system protein ParE